MTNKELSILIRKDTKAFELIRESAVILRKVVRLLDRENSMGPHRVEAILEDLHEIATQIREATRIHKEQLEHPEWFDKDGDDVRFQTEE